MAKDPSPLLGYNNNIRHKDRVFHIQTEDSGVRHPHIITHLFMDGGRILKSVKTSYAEHLSVERMGDLVRKMMKDQHKGMLIALRDGQFDHVIDGGDVPKPAAKAPEPTASVAALTAVAPSRVVEAPPHASPVPPVARPSGPIKPPSLPRLELVDLDMADLERAPDQAPVPGPDAPLDLQPPPANLFRPRTGGNYSTVVSPSSPPEPKHASVPPHRAPMHTPRPPTVPPGAVVSKSSGLKPSSSPASSRPAALASGGAPPRPPPIRRTSSPPPPVAGGPEVTGRPVRKPGVPAPSVAKVTEAARYASARPAAIFGQAKPRGGSSIFGEDIISDKSLDEVIMSYLADDFSAQGADGPSKSVAGRAPDPKRRK